MRLTEKRVIKIDGSVVNWTMEVHEFKLGWFKLELIIDAMDPWSLGNTTMLSYFCCSGSGGIVLILCRKIMLLMRCSFVYICGVPQLREIIICRILRLCQLILRDRRTFLLSLNVIKILYYVR